jgi:hypothetical protein
MGANDKPEGDWFVGYLRKPTDGGNDVPPNFSNIQFAAGDADDRVFAVRGQL